jgi:ppGpp synthetase/RelA/SpoT-type nucleotidyltranferase
MSQLVYADAVAWIKPLYNRGRVDAAGDILISPHAPELDYLEALKRISNWRSSHSYPLQALKMTLLGRAKKIDEAALVAQRLKRLSSIALKLERNPNMKLSQMQDMGGCRAVLRSVEEVEKLAAVYLGDRSRARPDRSKFVKNYDYIANPKADGYRGIHFVYKYWSSSASYVDFNGLRIEIQLRSKLQHAWATAVETVSTFTGQALKSNIGQADWKRFFAVAGSVIAMREKRPLAPGTPSERTELISELRDLWQSLRVETVLAGWSSAMNIALTQKATIASAKAFLLVLDFQAKSIEVTGYTQAELPQAAEDYILLETSTARKPEIQAVLVSVDSLAALRSAYPNYYLDTDAFISVMRSAMRPSPSRSASG